MVYNRIGRRLRALGMTTCSDYLAQLARYPDSDEWEHFTNALTTNLTAFFREYHHFSVLADLLRRAAAKGSVDLWCSASSSGEEPYSMAITALQALGAQAAKVHIVATDLDTNVLQAAAAGIYPLDRLERLPQGYAKRYFLKGIGRHAGFAKVRDEVRALVSFRQINLLDNEWPIRGPLDAIFCRNVMIYFDKPTQRRILQHFHPLLHAESLLFMGHSESLHNAADLFKLKGNTVYQPLHDR